MWRSLFYICLIVSLLFQKTLFAQQIDAILLQQKTSVTIKKNDLSRTKSFEILINNREGEKYAEIAILFSSLSKVSNITAYIKDKNGKIVKKLKKSDISERSYFSNGTFFQDQFVKEFRLKHHIYPYTLYYEYEEMEDEFIFIENWIPILDMDVPTLNAELVVRAGKNIDISYKNKFVSSFKKDSTDNEYLYKWQVHYNGSLRDESFCPPLRNHVPLVQVVPRNFRFEINGSFESWKTYGIWQERLIADLFEIPDDEVKTIEQLTSNIEDQKIKIRKIYEYVQNETRYINISLETGGLKPYPARYVSLNHYGDCKALSIYFMSLLKTIDIESYYAKLSAGSPIEEVDHSFPSLQSNHIVVCVPIKGDTLWLDCTSDNPFEYIGTFIQNREAFVIKGEKSFFSKIPELTKNQVLCERHVVIEHEMKNECKAEFFITYRGVAFEALQNLFNSTNTNDKLELLRENLITKGFEPEEIKNHEVLKDSMKALIDYSAKSSSFYESYGNDIIIRLIPFDIGNIESPVDRTLPVQIDYPFYEKDTIEYAIPINYKIQTYTDNKCFKSKYVTYSISTKIEKNFVKVTKSLLINSGKYPLSEYRDFYSFLKQIVEFENKYYIITTKKTL
nr:DUF3857 domain-containing protein [uncultured Draconibacterium sp.]